MIYDDFTCDVARRAGVSPEQAAKLTQATLTTLADRISGGGVEDIANQLPDDVAQYLRKPSTREPADPFGFDEFVSRVSDRAGVDAGMATEALHAVFTTLRQNVNGDEFHDMVAQLPKEFAPIVEPLGARPGSASNRTRRRHARLTGG